MNAIFSFLLVVLGIAMVALALADLLNTLVSTTTSSAKWWPSRLLGRSLFVAVRSVAKRLHPDSRWRELMLSSFAPVLVLALLSMWVALQILGFALIWVSLDLATITGFGDAAYFSGVVYLTVGFGEIVPTGAVARTLSLIEALVGVINVALVVGYLPTLYTAYSERERALMTLDAGGTERITPTALVKAWAPDADPKKIDDQFEKWEAWAAAILETHSTVPLLVLFRSHHRKQNWVTALGLLCDAALHAQIINGATDGNAYWFLRRAEAIFREVTRGADISAYQEIAAPDDTRQFLRDLYADLDQHGFSLRPLDEAAAYTRTARTSFAPAMEYLIDDLLCPRGFWPLESTVQSWSHEYELARHDE